MKQVAVVSGQVGEKLEISVKRNSACASCGACKMSCDSRGLTLLADNEIGAKVGDQVEVDMETPNVLGAAFIIYTIPLVALVAGVLLGNQILKMVGYAGNLEMGSILVGFLFLAVSFLGIKVCEPKFRDSKKYDPKIVSIINED